MKRVTNIFLFASLISILTITTAFVDERKEEEIKYEIISTGTIDHSAFTNASYFTLNTIFEYDDFWVFLTGNTTNKPYVDMKKSRLIVFGGGGTIDKISFSEGYINIYTTTKNITNGTVWYTDDTNYAATYQLIQIDYNSSPVKWFEQVIEEER